MAQMTCLKQLFLLLILFSASIGFTQEQQKKKIQTSAGVIFSADHTWLRIGNDEDYQSFVDQRNESLLPAAGYTIGGSIMFAVAPGVNLETGVSYALRGFKTEEVACNENYGDLQTSYKAEIRYLDIPFNFLFFLNEGKPKFYILAGLMQSSLLSAKAFSSNTQCPDQKISQTQPFIISLNLGAGVDIEFSDSFIFKIEPIFRNSITKYRLNRYKERLKSIGLSAGIYVRL